MIDGMNETAGFGFAADYIPILRFIPTPAKARCTRSMKLMTEFSAKKLAEHRKTYDRGTTYLCPP